LKEQVEFEILLLNSSPFIKTYYTNLFTIKIINKAMKKISLFILILSLLFSYESHAQGNLLLTPMRLIFDGSKNIQEINLVNVGNDTATFSISFIHYKMQEDGTLVKTENPDTMKMPAAPFLRIYPQQVTLAPGEPQVIMLQYRRNPDMKPGEYRSHLYFRAEKDNSPLGTKKANMETTTQLSIKLTAVYGLCIPIIIRTNEGKVSSTLSDLELERIHATSQNIKFTINRSGNISTYGDIIIEYIPLQGKSVQIAVVRGIGVYTDINKRKMVVKLNPTAGTLLTKGKVKVSYIANDESNKPVLYAEGEVGI